MRRTPSDWRFAREAQVLASLNHPGIAAVYGVVSSALVLELVEGPTLAERSGPMAWGFGKCFRDGRFVAYVSNESGDAER